VRLSAQGWIRSEGVGGKMAEALPPEMRKPRELRLEGKVALSVGPV
jgi:hypothetical protein